MIIGLQGQLVLSLGQLNLPKNLIVNAKVLSASDYVGGSYPRKKMKVLMVFLHGSRVLVIGLKMSGKNEL